MIVNSPTLLPIMSENSELTTAAATGAAAAVAAVQDEQEQEALAVATEAASQDAAVHADIAAEQAETAATVATEAVSEAARATETAYVAAEVASEAASVSGAVQSDVFSLREEMRARDAEMLSSMRSLLDERFPTPEQREQPREVVVTHGTDNSAQSGDNTGSGRSTTESGNTSLPRRHRFGSQRN